jgi:hypothetical protein
VQRRHKIAIALLFGLLFTIAAGRFATRYQPKLSLTREGIAFLLLRPNYRALHLTWCDGLQFVNGKWRPISFTDDKFHLRPGYRFPRFRYTAVDYSDLESIGKTMESAATNTPVLLPIAPGENVQIVTNALIDGATLTNIGTIGTWLVVAGTNSIVWVIEEPTQLELELRRATWLDYFKERADDRFRSALASGAWPDL